MLEPAWSRLQDFFYFHFTPPRKFLLRTHLTSAFSTLHLHFTYYLTYSQLNYSNIKLRVRGVRSEKYRKNHCRKDVSQAKNV